MEPYILPAILSIVGIIAGFTLAKLLEKKSASQLMLDAKKTASSLLKEAKMEAENMKKEKILQAKEKFIELKSEHEKDILSRDKKMMDTEKRIRDKESQVSNELAQNKKINTQLEKQIEDYQEKKKHIEKHESDLDRLHKRQIEQLEVISSLSAEAAKEQLVASLKGEAKTEAMAFIQSSMEEAKLTAQQEAKKVIINTIQRIGTEEAI